MIYYSAGAYMLHVRVHTRTYECSACVQMGYNTACANAAEDGLRTHRRSPRYSRAGMSSGVLQVRGQPEL